MISRRQGLRIPTFLRRTLGRRRSRHLGAPYASAAWLTTKDHRLFPAWREWFGRRQNHSIEGRPSIEAREGVPASGAADPAAPTATVASRPHRHPAVGARANHQAHATALRALVARVGGGWDAAPRVTRTSRARPVRLGAGGTNGAPADGWDTGACHFLAARDGNVSARAGIGAAVRGWQGSVGLRSHAAAASLAHAAASRADTTRADSTRSCGRDPAGPGHGRPPCPEGACATASRVGGRYRATARRIAGLDRGITIVRLRSTRRPEDKENNNNDRPLPFHIGAIVRPKSRIRDSSMPREPALVVRTSTQWR